MAIRASVPLLFAYTFLVFSLCPSVGAQPTLEASGVASDVAPREQRPCAIMETPPFEARSLWAANLWPGGVVPYEFDTNVSAANQIAMRQAMSTLEAVAYIRFVTHTGQANFLHIQDSQFNSSSIGMIGGTQIVNIYNWDNRFIMCHELMHALGVWHEQSRPDRAQYIVVNYANINSTCPPTGSSSCAYNFDIVPGAALGGYDFDSVMHYDQHAYAINQNQPTIQVLPPNQSWQGLIGQRTHLSNGDQAGLASRYSPPTPGWSLRALTGPNPRHKHGMVYDSWRGITVLQGGEGGGGTETWEWNRSSWNNVTLNPTPISCRDHALVFDSGSRVSVWYGGINSTGSVLPLTGQLLSGIWNYNYPATVGPRHSHAMAYDAARGVTVLFGGDRAYPASNLAGDTWEWNGSDWAARSISGPSPRSGHAMVYDSARGVTVLFGGSTPALSDETWEWNGTSGQWTLRNVIGPSARSGHAMAYDSARNVTVLFGGVDANGLNGQTWEYNGTAWSQRNIAGPSPRTDHAMAYDSARGSIILFGGFTGAFNGETWELLGDPCGAPTIIAQSTAQRVSPGGAISCAVVATGTGPLSYQWRKDGTPLTNTAGRIAGATTPTLALLNCTTSDFDSYDCIVSNSCGAATSARRCSLSASVMTSTSTTTASSRTLRILRPSSASSRAGLVFSFVWSFMSASRIFCRDLRPAGARTLCAHGHRLPQWQVPLAG